MKQLKKRRRSLQSIILISLLLFSVVPLSFLTGYSLVKYEQAIDEELKKRLEGNAREISVIFDDLSQHITRTGTLHASDTDLIQALSNKEKASLKRIIFQWLKNSVAARTSVFARDGLRMLSVRNVNGKPEVSKEDQNVDIYLSENILQSLKSSDQVSFREIHKDSGVEIVVYTRILDQRGNTLGYLEEILQMGEEYLKGLKKRLKLELVLLDKDHNVAVSSNEDFKLYPVGFFGDLSKSSEDRTFDLQVRDEPFGFMIRPLRPSEPSILIGLGASKKDVQRVIHRINLALVTVGGGLILLLIPVFWLISRIVGRPLSNLVDAAQRLAAGETVRDLPVEAATEIGVLTESFNQMKNKVVEARRDLENKVKELQQTQTQLIHSAKMVSLGQLVAGVAHELNNPIGYIYSNMTHLKEYSDKLVQLLGVAEKNPKGLEAAKKEMDFDYIVKDLPKLIKSCEDGALRTRDIVIGLRNFSRLDEATLKDVDIEEGLRNTLQLLSGEIKTRIKVHEDYGSIPKVRCFASHINQVFMNILSNAVQAIDGQGEIFIKTERMGERVRVIIRDTGEGMPQEVIDKIFDPFFTTKPIGQGTGLGLSISYGIVKKHGGEILVESKPKGGTVFQILLPINNPLLGSPSELRT